MTTQEIANRLTQLCQNGDFETAQKELFAQDAVSIEAHSTPAFEKETKGLKAILEKGAKWNSMLEKVNKMEVSEPIVAANSFALTIHMDIVMKQRGAMDMTELCVYEVKNGKILKEEFHM